MKKVIAILALGVIGVLAQSCGAGEKCPAYSLNEIEQGDQKS